MKLKQFSWLTLSGVKNNNKLHIRKPRHIFKKIIVYSAFCNSRMKLKVWQITHTQEQTTAKYSHNTIQFATLLPNVLEGRNRLKFLFSHKYFIKMKKIKLNLSIVHFFNLMGLFFEILWFLIKQLIESFLIIAIHFII